MPHHDRPDADDGMLLQGSGEQLLPLTVHFGHAPYLVGGCGSSQRSSVTGCRHNAGAHVTRADPNFEVVAT